MGEKKVERPGGGALPAEHSPTRYANARVCRRCGQSWPCTFELGVDLPESKYANEAEEVAVAEAILTAPQAIRAAWASDVIQGCIRW